MQTFQSQEETDNKYYTTLIDLINILSFIVGVQNINLNDKQIKDLQAHLDRQDAQYEEILRLLKER